MQPKDKHLYVTLTMVNLHQINVVLVVRDTQFSLGMVMEGSIQNKHLLKLLYSTTCLHFARHESSFALKPHTHNKHIVPKHI